MPPDPWEQLLKQQQGQFAWQSGNIASAYDQAAQSVGSMRAPMPAGPSLQSQFAPLGAFMGSPNGREAAASQGLLSAIQGAGQGNVGALSSLAGAQQAALAAGLQRQGQSSLMDLYGAYSEQMAQMQFEQQQAEQEQQAQAMQQAIAMAQSGADPMAIVHLLGLNPSRVGDLRALGAPAQAQLAAQTQQDQWSQQRDLLGIALQLREAGLDPAQILPSLGYGGALPSQSVKAATSGYGGGYSAGGGLPSWLSQLSPQPQAGMDPDDLSAIGMRLSELLATTPKNPDGSPAAGALTSVLQMLRNENAGEYQADPQGFDLAVRQMMERTFPGDQFSPSRLGAAQSPVAGVLGSLPLGGLPGWAQEDILKRLGG